MSSRHRATWGLQEDNHQTTRKERDHHRGWLSTERQEATEQTYPRFNLDRRNMVQAKSIRSAISCANTDNNRGERKGATTATSIKTKIDRKATRENNKARSKRRDIRRKSSNIHTTSRSITEVSRLLDQIRTSLEKSTRGTQDIVLLSWGNSKWSRHRQLVTTENNTHQATRWKQRKAHRRRVDNRTTATTGTTMDRINQLWREAIFQGTTWGRWRRESPSHQGERSHSTKATNRTRDHRAQLDTHAFQVMVSHLRTRKRKSRCTSAQNKQQADHPDRLRLPQSIQRRSSSTSADSNRHRDRTLFSNTGSQQSNNDGILCQQHHSIHHGDRQNISNTTEWQRALPQITCSSKGSRHLHKTFTSIQLTEPRQHRESTQNTLWTS